MLRQARPAFAAIAIFTVITGLLYPLLVTGIGQVAFGDEADGSPLLIDGEVRGSELIAQPFEGDEWFHPRPSAVDHAATSSGASNLGPQNPELLESIEQRMADYRERNQLPEGTEVPVDAVTASGSGLDPHISQRNAELQAPRVADARGLELEAVMDLVEANTERRTFGVLGESRVNVVTLNADLARSEG
jgi:K+-transporting ATPase ATPase C chain